MRSRRFYLWCFLITAAIFVGVTAESALGISGNVHQAERARTYFSQFVIAGGAIVWFILLPMSMITVCLIIEQLMTIRRKKLLPDGTVKDIITTIQKFGLNQFVARSAAKQDLITVAANYTIGQKGFEKGYDHIHNLIGESLQEQSLRLFRKIEWLNIIGNVSPMIGLFGTVVGMIEAFNQIVVAGGQPQPAQLADGISVALVTTYWGLLIAIPALTVQGMLRNRVEAVASEAAMEAETLVAEIAKIPSGGIKATENAA